MTNEQKFYPKWRWSIKLECVVEILGTGHFPSTFMVRLPNGSTTEVEEDQLTVPPKQV